MAPAAAAASPPAPSTCSRPPCFVSSRRRAEGDRDAAHARLRAVGAARAYTTPMLSNDGFRQFLKRSRSPEEPSSSHQASTAHEHEPEQRRFPADFATQQHAADVLRSLARDGRTDVASLRGAPALADVPPKLRSAIWS